MIIDMKLNVRMSSIPAHKIDWQDLEDVIRESLGADEVEVIDADVYLEEDDEEFGDSDDYS